jgi:hypothetical protein
VVISQLRSRSIAIVGATAVAVAGLLPLNQALAAPGHPTVVSDVPSSKTPNIIDGSVLTIHDAGSKVIAGGSFTQAQNPNSTTTLTRKYVLAFDKATGTIDTAFAPVLDDAVAAVLPGPTASTVYLAGRFNTVNGVNRRKIALVNLSDGSPVASFKGPAFNGNINDMVRAGDRLLVGGIFTTATATDPRNGLASLNATTGALDSYLTTPLTGHHNWTTGSTGTQAGVGPDKLALSPDGRQLVVIGNFKNAAGVLHDQIVKLDLGAGAATVANWNTDRYTPACRSISYDSYVRDVAFAPDGAYFVVVSTGAGYPGTLCDAVARWDAAATGAGQQPTWVNYSGGDTFLSVGITEQAIYVGGHIRWVNNSLGIDAAQPGAVARPSIAALDPVSGLPLAWNPGRNPRGYGITELLVTPEGLWLGHDQSWIGNYQYKRERIAFFPLAGGIAPHSTATANLPGTVYQAGAVPPSQVLFRVNAGGPTLPTVDGGPDWAGDSATAPSPYHNAGSNVATYTSTAAVDATVPTSTPAAVFSSERWDGTSAPEMQWDFPVPAGVQIRVRLYLANRATNTSTVGSRLFDVSIDGALKLNDFDPVAAAGGTNRGTMRSFSITSDGNVDLDFGHVKDAPQVQAIEIVKAPILPPTSVLNGVTGRTYDGATAVGAAATVANTDDTPWSNAKGAFWVGGTLFYGMNSALYRRTFDGTSFGTPRLVDPYHDARWDTVTTGSKPDGQTYAGSTVNFYAEIPNVTGMFYAAGRLYYTLGGQSGLYWRWFTPDSGTVGADKFTVAGATGFADSGGLFVSGGTLYMVSRYTGNLLARGWSGGAPTGTATVRSGPGVDGVNWRGAGVFVGP